MENNTTTNNNNIRVGELGSSSSSSSSNNNTSNSIPTHNNKRLRVALSQTPVQSTTTPDVKGKMKKMFPSNASSEIECPICWNLISDAFMAKCGHSFCYKCITLHLETSSICPACKVPLGANDIFPNLSLNNLIQKTSSSADILVGSGALGIFGSDDLQIHDIDTAVSKLLQARAELEKRTHHDQLELLELFLQKSKEQKETALLEIQSCIDYLDSDLNLIRNKLNSHKGQRSSVTRKNCDPFLSPSASSNIAEAVTPPPVIWTATRLQVSRKRTFEQLENETQPPLETIDSEEKPSPSLENTRQIQLQQQIERLNIHFQDLEASYFDLRTKRLDGSSEELEEFSESISRLSRVSGFKTLAKIHYADKILTGTSSIVSSIEFDKEDEHFATAGVTRKIKVFEYANVVWDYRDRGLNLLTESGVQDKSLLAGLLRNSITGRKPSGGGEVDDTDGDTDDPNSQPFDDVPRYPILEMGGRSKISCLSWNPYMKSILASSDYEGLVTLWDTATGMPVTEFDEHEKRAWSVDFCKRDPVLLASGGDDTKVKVWSTTQKGSVSSIETKANICSVKWNPHVSHELAFGSADHHVHYYDLRKPNQPLWVLQGHRKAVSYVHFVSKNEIVSASTDCTLRLWDVSVGGVETMIDQAIASRNILSTLYAAGTPLALSNQVAPTLTPSRITPHRSTSILSLPNNHWNTPGLSVPSPAGAALNATPEVVKSHPLSGGKRNSPCQRVFSGHTNEKNFVGLSVNCTGDFIACGSEINSVFVYYSKLSKPVIEHPFGNPIHAISGEEVPERDPGHFVSSVCWKRNSPDILLAANSQGRIKVMQMYS